MALSKSNHLPNVSFPNTITVEVRTWKLWISRQDTIHSIADCNGKKKIINTVRNLGVNDTQESKTWFPDVYWKVTQCQITSFRGVNQTKVPSTNTCLLGTEQPQKTSGNEMEKYSTGTCSCNWQDEGPHSKENDNNACVQRKKKPWTLAMAGNVPFQSEL